MKRTIALLSLLVVGCEPASTDSPATSAPGEPERWTLSESPLVSIGVVEGEAAYQLHAARSSRKLPDGRIAVVNGGTHEVRFYDGEGRYLEAFGQEGDGPGEFRGAAHLHLTEEGGLRIWDSRLRRYSFHAADGSHERIEQLPTEPSINPFPADVWYYRRHLVDTPLRPDQRAPIAEVIDGLPPLDSTTVVRHVRLTEQGRLWSWETGLPADESVEVSVRSLTGELVATVTLPPRFEPHDIGPDYLLGRALDELDVNYIREYRLEKPAGSAPGPGLERLRALEGRPVDFASRAPDDEAFAEVASSVKYLASAQEINYSRNSSYTTDLDQLDLENVPEGVRIDFLGASPQGWTGIARHAESGSYCIIAYGFDIPMGWYSGTLVCPGR